MSQMPQRFIGMDVHKSFLIIAAVDQQQNILLKPRRVPTAQLGEWAVAHLQPNDVVVLEACSLAWTLYDQLAPLVSQVVVVHAGHVKLIASSLIKTDLFEGFTEDISYLFAFQRALVFPCQKIGVLIMRHKRFTH